MRIHLGSDHAGFDLKAKIIARLQQLGHEAIDHGPTVFDPEDDYPVCCVGAAAATVDDPGSLGVVLGGSGNGEAIAANKVQGARCALAYSEDTARLGRAHNNANVLSLGARMLTEADALKYVDLFLATPFSGEERHVRRIEQLAQYERTKRMP